MKKIRRWPVAGDSPLDQARTTARDYRNALLAADPDTCAALDQRAIAVGQPWIIPTQGPIDLNRMLTAPDLADYLGNEYTAPRIRQWGTRGHVPRHTNTRGETVYRVGDALDYIASIRRARAARRTG